MADRGTMIALRINNDRIRTLAPLHLRTPATGPDGLATIVAPDVPDLHATALELQQALRRKTGEILPIVNGNDMRWANTLSRNCIALGNAANNPLLRRLQDLQCLANRDCVRNKTCTLSIHNPLGNGHNVVAVLGRDADALRRVVRDLPNRLFSHDGKWEFPKPIYQIDPVSPPSDPEAFLAKHRQTDASAYHGRPGTAIAALDHLVRTGSQGWARAFIELITPYATGDIPLSFWLMSAVDFWTDRLVVGWDRIEQLPWFTEEERLLVANFIASCTEYCHDSITYQKWSITDAEHQIFNHHTFPAKGLFFGAMYLRRHGYEVADLDVWMDKSGRVFRRAAEAGRSFDEGGAGYSWLVGNHLIEVHLARGDSSYLTTPKLRHYAHLATVIQNNHFELVPFGDCGSYHGGGAGAANILLQAAEWHRNPGFRWVAEKCAPETAADDLLTAGLQATPPDQHLGLFVLPMDPVIWRWTGLPRFPNYPPPLQGPTVPPEQGFDKISLRGGWGPDDDYLLLQGFGCGQHGHPDANSISQYQANGRLFLVDNDYIRRMPKQHNMIMVIRDGQFAPLPVTARLDAAEQFDGGALTQTTLPDTNGCDWKRTLLWLANDCVLVIDEVTAQTPGDYEIRCYWRTLGDARLTDAGLHAEQDGEHFHVIELTESDRRLDLEPPPFNRVDYPEYKYGDPRPKTLSQTQHARLGQGQSIAFVNLLLPNGKEPGPRRTITWTAPDTIQVAGNGPAITVTQHSIDIRGLWQQALPDASKLRALDSPRRGSRSTPTSPPASSPEFLWSTQLPAKATSLHQAEATGTVVGCEDGSVIVIDSDGSSRTLAKADETIGAVLAGPLYGEAEPTVLAATHEQTLLLLRLDGTLRARVELPRNGHMPAWGRALCLADLDGDGHLWPIVGTAAWRVHAVNPDASLRWTFDTAAHAVTCLAAGDLNGDGREELAMGTVYFCVPAATADGERLWEDEDYNDFWRAGPRFPFIEIGDVDGDGRLEVLTAASDTLVHCIDSMGQKKWTYSIGDDPAGLARQNGTILAASRTGDVHAVDGHGTQRWRRQLNSPCTGLAVTGKRICAATENRQLHWLEPDGTPKALAQLASPITHLRNAENGHVLASTTDAKLHRINTP